MNLSSKEKKFKIFIENSEQIVFVSQGLSLLAGLLKNKIEINHSCGGNGTCGTCLVKVTSDLKDEPARNEFELEMAKDRGFSPEERLACQVVPTSNLSILIL